MGKYTKKQLNELAAGAFKCSPNEKSFYANDNGTFLNETQYNKLSDEDKKAYTKIDNPKFAVEEAPTKGKKEAAKADDNEGADEEEEGEEGEGEDEGMKVPAGPKVPVKGKEKTKK
jgi:hypothetical protein